MTGRAALLKKLHDRCSPSVKINHDTEAHWTVNSVQKTNKAKLTD